MLHIERHSTPVAADTEKVGLGSMLWSRRFLDFYPGVTALSRKNMLV